MKKITGYHIDPTAQTITQVEVEAENLQDIYRVIKADCFDSLRLPNETRDMVFIDDEGLLNGAMQTHGAFVVAGNEQRWPVPLAGHALVLGCDPMGNSISAQTPLDELQQMIEFATPAQIRERALKGEFGR